LGAEPLRVASLGRAILDGLRDGGVVGVVKHMPGHGRATADSHLELPVVTADDAALDIDIAPFERLNDAPMGMTAHVVYTAWDAERPASLSPVVIDRIIRGRIGFDGLLMSDDLDMKALKGERGALAAEVIAAGCDIALDCWGRMNEMQAIANAVDDISPDALRRLDAAMATIATPPAAAEFADLVAKRDALLALA
jgi:beta-N-acetylhexosaminidase